MTNQYGHCVFNSPILICISISRSACSSSYPQRSFQKTGSKQNFEPYISDNHPIKLIQGTCISHFACVTIWALWSFQKLGYSGRAL